MAIIKNEIPILEYDDNQMSVIMPTHEHLDFEVPEKVVFPFLGETVEEYAKAHGAVEIATFVSMTKLYPIYIIDYKGEKIGLCQAPVGSAPAAQILDWLIGYGAKKIISAGSCGALVDLSENTFLVPTRALRDEGTSYHYLPPSRYVELNQNVLKSIEQTFQKLNLTYQECMTWTTDGFYRETKEKVAYRKEEGCSVVEMECAALAACAEFRGVEFGQILYTADTLANTEDYDERDWGDASLEKALWICLELIREM